MNSFLLDTNTVSEAVSTQPNQNVLEWLSATDEQLLYISVLTLGEIRKGIAGLVVASRRRQQLEAWLDEDLRQRFAGVLCR